MLTEPKYCEMCSQQFFRCADAPIPERSKYCAKCDAGIARAAQEQESNRLLIGRQYYEYRN